MPWKETHVMDEKMRFIAACVAGEEAMAELCRRSAISRKTGYKWLSRYQTHGAAGLADRSRAPHRCPHRVEPAIERLILAARADHPTWGPRKLLAWLEQRHGEAPWPVASTVGELLSRHGLVVRRRRRRRATPSGPLPAMPTEPGALWCADFKGWFRTGDGERCTPLTISDAASRYLLRCQGLGRRTGAELVRPIFEAAFREHGLPVAMRTDNGPPFASVGLGGLSRLSVWWIRLGIRPERIEPGHPEQNGRHERMHRTLAAETTRPAARNRRAQQRVFDRFVREYNEERPHEALGQRPPAEQYRRSVRLYPSRLAEVEYHDDWTTRAVRGAGQMKWRGDDVHISGALVGERIGLEPIDDGVWRIHFGAVVVGEFDERKLRAGPSRKEPKTA